MTGADKNPKWFALVLLLVLPPLLQAAPALDSNIDATRFFAGDGFTWTLVVTGAKQVDDPEIAGSLDFFSRALKPRIVEDQNGRTYVYRYQLVPRRAGLLPLPDLVLVADDEELVPESRALNVAEPQSCDGLRLEMTLDRNEVYAGQPVGVTFKLLSSLQLDSLSAMDIRLPLLYSADCDVIVPLAERKAGGTPGTIGLPVEGQRVIGTLGEVTINDVPFTVITFRRILVPHAAGELVFPAARVLCSHRTDLPEKRRGGSPRYPSYFNNDFFQEPGDQTPYVRYSARSESLSLRVLPLPEAGRPPDFSGVVGHGSLLAEADPQSLVIGDPVTLTLRLRSFPMSEAIKLPPLAALATFKGQFQIPETQASPRHLPDESVYVNSIRPLRTAITRVPALKLVIFNPNSARYETLASEPIPLRIRPDGEITSIESDGGTPGRLATNPQGIWHNLQAGDVDPLTRVGHILKISSPAWLLGPPLLFLSFAGAARKHRFKRSDPERWCQLTAFSKLRKGMAHAATPNARRTAAACYLSTRLGIREAALSEWQIRRALDSRGIKTTAETRDCLRDLFLRPDLEHFGHTEESADEAPDARRILAALESVERKLKS